MIQCIRQHLMILINMYPDWLSIWANAPFYLYIVCGCYAIYYHWKQDKTNYLYNNSFSKTTYKPPGLSLFHLEKFMNDSPSGNFKRVDMSEDKHAKKADIHIKKIFQHPANMIAKLLSFHTANQALMLLCWERTPKICLNMACGSYDQLIIHKCYYPSFFNSYS